MDLVSTAPKALGSWSLIPRVTASKPWALPPSGPRGAEAPGSAHSSLPACPLQAAEKGRRKRYEPSDKARQSPPPAKRANLSPDRGELPGCPWTVLGSPKGLGLGVVPVDTDSTKGWKREGLKYLL